MARYERQAERITLNPGNEAIIRQNKKWHPLLSIKHVSLLLLEMFRSTTCMFVIGCTVLMHAVCWVMYTKPKGNTDLFMPIRFYFHAFLIILSKVMRHGNMISGNNFLVTLCFAWVSVKKKFSQKYQKGRNLCVPSNGHWQFYLCLQLTFQRIAFAGSNHRHTVGNLNVAEEIAHLLLSLLVLPVKLLELFHNLRWQRIC